MKKRTFDFRALLYTFSLFLFFTAILLYATVLPMNIQHTSADATVVSQENLYSDVLFLSTLNPPRSYNNLDSLNKAADYIEGVFKTNCKNTEVQKYSVERTEYKNIICRFSGSSKSRIVVGAHYDVAGEKPGADDNASGVAGLLELVRLTKAQASELPFDLEFVAYTLEEPPYFRTENMGSAIHAQSLKDAKVQLKLMMSLEMIGYYSEKKNSQFYPVPLINMIYPSEGNFIGVVGKITQAPTVYEVKQKMLEGSHIDVRSFSPVNIIPGLDFSDHLNYWNRGYKAVMITDTAFYRNDAYHTEADSIERLNFEKMAQVVQAVFWTITHLDSGQSEL